MKKQGAGAACISPFYTKHITTIKTKYNEKTVTHAICLFVGGSRLFCAACLQQ
jgi:hypothetical protein